MARARPVQRIGLLEAVKHIHGTPGAAREAHGCSKAGRTGANHDDSEACVGGTAVSGGSGGRVAAGAAAGSQQARLLLAAPAWPAAASERGAAAARHGSSSCARAHAAPVAGTRRLHVGRVSAADAMSPAVVRLAKRFDETQIPSVAESPPVDQVLPAHQVWLCIASIDLELRGCGLHCRATAAPATCAQACMRTRACAVVHRRQPCKQHTR